MPAYIPRGWCVCMCVRPFSKRMHAHTHTCTQTYMQNIFFELKRVLCYGKNMSYTYININTYTNVPTHTLIPTHTIERKKERQRQRQKEGGREKAREFTYSYPYPLPLSPSLSPPFLFLPSPLSFPYSLIRRKSQGNQPPSGPGNSAGLSPLPPGPDGQATWRVDPTLLQLVCYIYRFYDIRLKIRDVIRD